VATAFVVSQYVDADQTAKVAADGTATITFGPVPPGHVWRVSRVAVQGFGPGTCNLYVGDHLPQDLRDGSATGAFDIGEYPSPLSVPATQNLVLAWAGMTAATVVTGAIQYVELAQVVVPDPTSAQASQLLGGGV
jgi:hypothetical protein